MPGHLGAVSLKKSHDIIMLRFCNIVEGQATYFNPVLVNRKTKNRIIFGLWVEGHHHYSSWHPGKKGDKGGRF